MDNELGLLIPPYLLHEDTAMAYSSIWGKEYRNVDEVAKRIGLNAKIWIADRLPQGTCFWARTQALKKLLVYNWRYEDFVPEPMPDSNTISHGVERKLGFVVADSGYESKIVFTDEYASSYINTALDCITCYSEGINSFFKLQNANRIKKFELGSEKLKQISSNVNKIYIYMAAGNGVKT